MYEGLAVGGPRDGVKLLAGNGWDGRVRLKSPTDPQAPTPTDLRKAFYPGRYKWNPKSNEWIWIPEK